MIGCQMQYFEKADLLWRQAAEEEREASFEKAYMLYTEGCEQAVRGLRIIKNEVLLNEYAMKVRHAMIALTSIKLEDSPVPESFEEEVGECLQYEEISSDEFGEFTQILQNDNAIRELMDIVVLPARFPSLYEHPNTPVVISGLELTGKTALCHALCKASECTIIDTARYTDVELLERELKTLSNEFQDLPEVGIEIGFQKYGRSCIVYHDFRYLLDPELVGCLSRISEIPHMFVLLECQLECLSGLKGSKQVLTEFCDSELKQSEFITLTKFAGIELPEEWVEQLKEVSFGAILAAYDEEQRALKRKLILNTKWVFDGTAYKMSENEDESSVLTANFFSLEFGSVTEPELLPEDLILQLEQFKVSAQRWALYTTAANDLGVSVPEEDSLP